VDLSNGQLTVSATGLVTVKANALPGSYTVQAKSYDDPNVSAYATVQVRATAELDVTIR
jgi:hypothetical protein